MTKFEMTGEVKAIGEEQVFPSGFTKRTIVVDCSEPQAKYGNPIPFDLKKERCALGDTISVGDKVRVGFTVDGRQWDNPDGSGTRYFINLTAWDIEKVGSTSVGVTVSADAYPHTAQGAWTAWCKTRDAKDAAGFATFIGETCPVVASTAKAKGMKFSQVANEEDWARIIDALTGDGADETPADDPSDLPF